MKKGISLIILVITIIIMLIISAMVIGNGINMTSDVEYIRFEKEIEIIEKAVKKSYLKDKIYGVKPSVYATDITNTISLINNTHGLVLDEDNIYVINEQDLKNMGITNIKGEYIVDYQKGYVFSLQGIENEGEIIYTTQKLN